MTTDLNTLFYSDQINTQNDDYDMVTQHYYGPSTYEPWDMRDAVLTDLGNEQSYPNILDAFLQGHYEHNQPIGNNERWSRQSSEQQEPGGEVEQVKSPTKIFNHLPPIITDSNEFTQLFRSLSTNGSSIETMNNPMNKQSHTELFDRVIQNQDYSLIVNNLLPDLKGQVINRVEKVMPAIMPTQLLNFEDESSLVGNMQSYTNIHNAITQCKYTMQIHYANTQCYTTNKGEPKVNQRGSTCEPKVNQR